MFNIIIIFSKGDNIQSAIEDNHIIVINKASSEIVQGDRTGDKPFVGEAERVLKRNTTNLAMFFVE